MLDQIRQSFHGIVVVLFAGNEAHGQIHSIGGTHGLWSGIEIDGLPAGGPSTIEHSFGEQPSEAEAARLWRYPEPLQLPGGRSGCRVGRLEGSTQGHRTPGNETRWLAVCTGHHAATTLFEVALGQAFGFLFQGCEAKAGGAGLGDYESAVVEQEGTSLGDDC